MEGQQIQRNDGRRAHSGLGHVRPNQRPVEPNLAKAEIVIKISSKRLKEVLSRLFQHMMVMSFVGPYTSTQAKSWLKDFNGKSAT